MMKYLEMVKKDVRNAIEDDYYDVTITNNKWDKVKMYSQLLKQMWNDEHITGSNCEGYYFSTSDTIKMVQENIDEVKEAYDFFNCDLMRELERSNYIEIDTRTRCYFLLNVLYDALKETKTI